MIKYAQRLSKDRVFGQPSQTRRFVREEDGAFTIFVLFMFLILVALTGMAADFMNYERDRANLQSTLDRAVLAAADLDQTLDPKTVVKEYLDKAGLGDKLKGEPVVTPGFGFRRVEAQAETKISTNFMRLTGTDTLTAIAASAAEESVGSVEIALVLDMSGSMGDPSAEAGRDKIDVLQEAAKKFVTLMLARDDADAPLDEESGAFEQADKVSIAIVPYATQVNAGSQILDKMSNVTAEHDYSHCINFPSTAFSQAHLNFVTRLDRTAHFDPWSTTEKSLRYRVCPVRAGSDITPPTDNLVRLHKQIDAMTADGATSIEIGMKWGAVMLDPSFRNIATKLTKETLPGSTEKVIPEKFEGRPLSYEDDDVLKVIIVMTDGQNTSQRVLKSSLRSGNSDVWYNPDYTSYYGRKGEYSVRRSDGYYYWTRQGRVERHPYGDGYREPGTSTRLTYPQLWDQVSLRWNAVYNYGWQYNSEYYWHTNAYYNIGSSSKNSRTKSVCDAAKKNAIIYGIAFEAPSSGLATIKDCASSDSHVYEVNAGGSLGSGDGSKPITLEEAFVSIASSISKLRLTQ